MIVKRSATSKHADKQFLIDEKLYFVFAILVDVPIQYLVWEESSFSFPFYVSSQAVDLLDAEITKGMWFSPALDSSDIYSSRAPMIGFSEIVKDRHFYQRLVDGEIEAVRAWNEFRDGLTQ